MAKKKKKVKNIRSDDLPSKWIDTRAIIPAIIIGILWGLYVSFQLPVNGVSEFILMQFGISTTFAATDAFVFSISLLIRVFVFFVDFVIAFIIAYLFFWTLLRERDKKYYYHLKKEGKL